MPDRELRNAIMVIGLVVITVLLVWALQFSKSADTMHNQVEGVADNMSGLQQEVQGLKDETRRTLNLLRTDGGTR